MDYPVDGVPWQGVVQAGPLTLTPMDCDDMESVVSVSQPVLGKRKKPVSDEGRKDNSEEEEIVSKEEPPRRMTRAKYKKEEPPAVLRPGVPGPSRVVSKFFVDSDTNTQSCSEVENTKNKIRHLNPRDKVSGQFISKTKKKKASEPTIEELRPLPEQLDELEVAPTAQSVAFALEWLEDIDLIRGKSSY